MPQLFPHANAVCGSFLLVVGFAMHWIGQIAFHLRGREREASGMTRRLDLSSPGALVMATGWVHGLSGVGLITGLPWAPRLAWVSGVLLIILGIASWPRSPSQRHFKSVLKCTAGQVVWFLAQLVTGLLAIAVSWRAL